MNPSEFISLDTFKSDLTVHAEDLSSTMRLKWLAQSLVIKLNSVLLAHNFKISVYILASAEHTYAESNGYVEG